MNEKLHTADRLESLERTAAMRLVCVKLLT